MFSHTLPYPTLPYPTQPYPTLSYPPLISLLSFSPPSSHQRHLLPQSTIQHHMPLNGFQSAYPRRLPSLHDHFPALGHTPQAAFSSLISHRAVLSVEHRGQGRCECHHLTVLYTTILSLSCPGNVFCST